MRVRLKDLEDFLSQNPKNAFIESLVRRAQSGKGLSQKQLAAAAMILSEARKQDQEEQGR